jgi:CIC family chloride channel protein
MALGREGPSVQIGAGLASVIARNTGLSAKQVKALVPVGCSAALAAAFNTPIAAVLFSLEEIMGDLNATVLGTAVLSSATSWMVLHLILGDDPLFHVTGYRLINPWELAVYAVLGVVGGLGSTVFVKLLLYLRQWFARLPRNTVWFQPVAGGLAVGIMGYFAPNVMGVGYSFVEQVLNGDVVLKTVIVLGVLKIIATAMCYSSGNAGGIFGPSLFIGAMMGAAVGSIAHTLFPSVTAGPGAYALVGMGTAFAGIVRTPLTSVIMIFEVTRDYTIIVPLMVSNLIAYFIASRLQKVPIYEALAEQDGIHLPTAEARAQAGRSQVAHAMREASLILAPDTPASTALEQVKDSLLNAWPVADQQGLCGMLRATELEKASANGFPPKNVRDLLNNEPESAHVHPDHPLSLALERMGSNGLRALPVVSRANVRQLLGIVLLDDILDFYGVNQPSDESEPQE